MGNKYEHSIMTDDLETCYVCKKKGKQQYHHIFNGPNRNHSTEDGLWIPVCFECHVKIHNERSQHLMYCLKQDGQWKYEELHSHDEFMKRYGRNYL